MSSSNTASSDNKKKDLPRIDKVTSVGKTKWLELQTLDYTDQEGTTRKWDMVTRTTKVADGAADAVIIIPLLKRYNNDEVLDTLLVEQYRPPVGTTTIEFPAGLVDKGGETPSLAALRELKEETGYVGEACTTLPQVSRLVCMSPGATNETVHVVVVMVDLDNPYNKGVPKPQLEDGEHIQLKRVSLKEGLKTLLDEGSSMPIEGLYLFALGFEMGSKHGK